ncbi:hypothetical protein [Paenibacillus sabuli]|uniref:hypothetical protein n=1 Tax=Paenibacillus sabuli TaxID=2772509 RepID=UPI001CC2E6AD|nr:hypothetical protein [Paenibacillus sabuli]
MALFYKLFFVLTSITLSFAVIYYVLAFNQVVLRVADHTGDPAQDSFWTYLYFSGVTILSIRRSGTGWKRAFFRADRGQPGAAAADGFFRPSLE